MSRSRRRIARRKISHGVLFDLASVGAIAFPFLFGVQQNWKASEQDTGTNKITDSGESIVATSSSG